MANRRTKNIRRAPKPSTEAPAAPSSAVRDGSAGLADPGRTVGATLPPVPYASAYRGAVGGRLSTPWQYSSLDPRLRFGTEWDRRTMADRARELQRNNAIAAGMLERLTENVVGDGFKLQVTTASASWNKRAQTLMEQWFPTADSSGLTWLEHQRLLYMAGRRDGDCGDLLLDDGTLQLVEGDLIGNPLSPDYAKAGWVDGVQLGAGNRPTNYSVAILTTDLRPTFATVAAQDMILWAKKIRNTGRGMSAFASTFNLFDQLDSWIEAQVVAARVGACYSLVVTKAAASTAVSALAAATTATASAQAAAAGTTLSSTPAPQMKLAPGTVQYLLPGESISQINPTQPAQHFPDCLRALLRILGAPFGMPIELITLDFSTTTPGTARAAMLQAYSTFKTEQRMFIDSVLSRIYRWRISKFIKAGLLPYRADAFRHRWIGRQWPMLDPLKELQAKQLEIDMGLATLTDHLQQMGHDFDSWLQVRAAEIAKMREADIPLIHESHTQPFVKVTDANASTDPLSVAEDAGETPAEQDKEDNGLSDDDEGGDDGDED